MSVARRDIAQEIRRATSARQTDFVASRYSITRSDLVDGPLTIAQKGIYTLSGSLAKVRWSETYREVILIASSNVELNLAGHEVSLDPAYAGSVPPDFALVRLAPGVQSVYVKGGTLRRAPIAVSTRNVKRVHVSDVDVLGCFRRGYELCGTSNVELLRSKVWLGPRSRSTRYEHAHQLLRLLHEDETLAMNVPTTLVPELESVLRREDEERATETDPFDGWDGRDPPPPTQESGAVAIEISSSPEGAPAVSALLDYVRATVVAEPQAFCGVLLDGESVLRDDAGYPISWEALFDDPQSEGSSSSRDVSESERKSRRAVMLAQLWIGSQRGSLPEDVLDAAAVGGEPLVRLRERCVPVLDGDFRGTPLAPPRALALIGATNGLFRRCEFACYNVGEPDVASEEARAAEARSGEPGYFSPFEGFRRDALDAVGVRMESGSQSCTFDSVLVAGVQSSTGWATGFSVDGSSLIFKDCRLGPILAVPTRHVDGLADDVRAVGVDFSAESKDVQIDNLRLDEPRGGEISCGSAHRGFASLLSHGVPPPGKSFSATLGQVVLGFN